MVFSEDVKSLFRQGEEFMQGGEISLYGRSVAVISGHKGLSALSDAEVIVRLKKGRVRVVGENLRVERAGASEIFVSGVICGVDFPEATREVRL